MLNFMYFDTNTLKIHNRRKMTLKMTTLMYLKKNEYAIKKTVFTYL